MEERRKYKRKPLSLEITIPTLFKQDKIKLENMNQNIEVINISKSGIGFYCDSELPLGYYFNAKINVTEDKFFYGVLKIVRQTKVDHKYSIGAEFVGLADILGNLIDEYEDETN